jgi:fatty-acyl-CoA synthase
MPASTPDYPIALTVGALYERMAADYGDGDLVFPGERCQYRELAARAKRMARSLRALGIGRGDAVGILMVPCIDALAALGAVAHLAAVAVPINVRFKARELSHVIADADLRVMLVSGALPPHADYPRMLAQGLPSFAAAPVRPVVIPEAPDLHTLVLMSSGDEPGFMPRSEFDALADDVSPDEIDRAGQTALVRGTAIIMYTSGTEAKPKGCLLTHEALTRTASNCARSRFELTPEDRMWNPLPLFHCGGIVLALTCFSAGTSFIHSGFFEPGVALHQMVNEQCTVAHPAFETIWLAVLNHPEFDAASLSRIRATLLVGVPERIRAMHQRLPDAKVMTSFGATEASAHLALTDPDDDLEHRLAGSARPMPGMEVRIVDPDSGEDQPTDVEGEVLYRGPGLFSGYHKLAELNALSFDAGGWFHSQDVGVLDRRGNLCFRSRLKDMLKVGGENVGSAEIEGAIAEHADVLIVQVVGAPDRRYNEVPCAFVQLRAGATMTATEIINTCVGQIASYKVPRYVRFVGEWPMSGTKIRKVDLRRQITEELAAAGVTEAPPLSGIFGGGRTPTEH